MKLDLEIVRDILSKVEDSPADAPMLRWSWNPESGVEGYRFFAHVALLIDHGWLEGKSYSDLQMRPCEVVIHRLSMTGHEFLGQVRNSTVWQKLKVKAAENGGSLTLAVAQSLAEKYTTKWLGLED